MFRRYFLLVLPCLLLAASMSSLSAGELPAAEEGKINSLISHVEGLTNTKFIRNGKAYDATTAAKFLRGKWKANKDKIHSAQDFIDHAATVSGTTGQKYIIQLENGEKPLCADYLKARLKKIETQD